MDYAADEQLHRLIKRALDSGEASTVHEAEQLFLGYQLELCIDAEQAKNALDQAALLTAVAVARRVFLGGVFISGELDVELQVLRPFGSTLGGAVLTLGGRLEPAPLDTPKVFIGGGPRRSPAAFAIRTAAAGWRGGVLPAASERAPAIGPVNPLAAMLAAGLAVNEAFLHVGGGAANAGRRTAGFSLWDPAPSTDWLEPDRAEPPLQYLPTSLWLIGLGHLGQAYLWALSLLPYDDPAALSLVLQDVDLITPSTESTSILTSDDMVGLPKTRAMAEVSEEFGFRTRIVERLFDSEFARRPDEPAVALCGIDNALGRRALDQVGFSLVLEAGLGRGHRDFRAMRLHALPGQRSAADIWRIRSEEEVVDAAQPAYRRMLESGELDRCGITRLAGRAVGAPFVGAVAASLVLSELLRILHGSSPSSVIDLDLECVEHRTVVPSLQDFSAANPGFTGVRTQ